MNSKAVCENRRCGWHGKNEELLSALDPFNEGEMLYACPRCRDIGSVLTACDEPECWKPASCGTPTPQGYRQTCSDHAPRSNHE